MSIQNNYQKSAAWLVVILVVLSVAFVFWYLRSMAGVAGDKPNAPTANVPGVNMPQEPESWVCTMDAKICPDGSAVGRTGPKCEFAPCPPADATKATVTTFLGGSATALNLTINPIEIVSDSRCPQDVQCVWAGTVEVRAAVVSPAGQGEQTFKLGEVNVVGDYSVMLTSVTPAAVQGGITQSSSYRFTFEIEKK